MDPVAESSSALAAGSVAPVASSNSPAANPPKPTHRMDTDSLAPRTLVLCFDGTANQYDGTNTNVVKFYSLLKKDSTDEQLCYYQIGLLPKDNPEQVPMAYKLYKRTDADSIQLAAGFKQTFCRDVKIEFVGVWDTVASVGVLMGKTLPFTTSNTTIKTFRHALSLDEHRAKFRPNLYHRPPPDTPVPTPPQSPASRYDEKQPASPVATSPTSEVQRPLIPDSTDPFTVPDTPKSAPAEPTLPARKGSKHAPFSGKYVQAKASQRGLRALLRRFPKHAERKLTNLTDPSDGNVGETDVKEVWFAGCHSDVGGGSVPNTTTHCLSDISLRWMVREAVLAQCGIQFDSDALERAGIPNSVFQSLLMHVRKSSHAHGGDMPAVPAFFRSPAPKSKPDGGEMSEKAKEAKEVRRRADSGVSMRSGPAEVEEIDPATDDALQPIHDELQLDKWWWMLEIVPTEYSWQDGAGKWHNKWGGRKIPEDIHPQFHESVKHRMGYAPLNYKPRAIWKAGTETYVP
ncbi:hypothetical protein EIP86_003711 [Pleurotus ostreatoroseus]|nr:hypothetical protein EIP86_003711 [Pleurotus ostreatoroseus]